MEGAEREEAQQPGKGDRVVETSHLHVRLADEIQLRFGAALEPAFHGRERNLLMLRDELRLDVAGWKCDQHRSQKTHRRTPFDIDAGLFHMHVSQCVESAHRRDHESAGDECGGLVVREEHERPGIQEIGGEVADDQRPLRGELVADRVLHERVRHQDEVRRKPGPKRGETGRDEVLCRTEAAFAPNHRPYKRAFEEEREHALHREGLTDHAS